MRAEIFIGAFLCCTVTAAQAERCILTEEECIVVRRENIERYESHSADQQNIVGLDPHARILEVNRRDHDRVVSALKRNTLRVGAEIVREYACDAGLRDRCSR